MVNGNPFQLTPEEEIVEQRKLKEAKDEFESLCLDYYKDFEYGHFTEFISSLEHYVQSYGPEKLVYDYVNEDRLKGWLKHESLFAVGYSEYLCNKYKLDKPEYISDYSDIKMDKLLFHQGVMLRMGYNVYSSALESYYHKLSELYKHNIVIETVEDIA